jgi:hypothetical protein
MRKILIWNPETLDGDRDWMDLAQDRGRGFFLNEGNKFGIP